MRYYLSFILLTFVKNFAQLQMTMAENRIVVSISEYQPTHKRIGKIVERLEQFNVNYDLRPYDKKQRFNRPLSMSANSRLERECISNGCGQNRPTT